MNYYPPYWMNTPTPANNQYTLQVEGIGSVQAEPDIAIVQLGVRTENKNLTTAQAENARIVTDVINTLNRMGIPSKDISTQAYTITPQYSYVEGEQIFQGYVVLHTLEITIRNLDQTGQIIDAAVASGANYVNNITFTISNPSRYYRQSLELAIEDARAKAITISRKLQVNLYPVPIKIIEQRNNATPIQPMMIQAESTTPIQAGQLEIIAQIQTTFTYANR